MKRRISGFMVTCLTASSLFMSVGGWIPQASAASAPISIAGATDEWTELSGILDSYKGVYTKDTKLGSPWDTNHSPDGPLMGNGTVFAFMAGDRKEQNIYISRSDMWRDRASNNGQQHTTLGGITIRATGDTEAATEFRYEQDMKLAEIIAQSEKGFQTKSWLSAKENIMVTEILNKTDAPLAMEVAAWTANSNTTASVDGKLMIATKTGTSEASNRASGAGTWQGWTANAAMASTIIDDIDVAVQNVDSKRNTTSFTLPASEKVTLVSAVEGSMQDGDTDKLGEAILQAKSKVESRSTAEAIAASNEVHRNYWKQYWLKSYINIQDESIERMYYGMLYMLGCATSVSSENNAGLPAGLFPWTAADNPDWQGDYTTNTDMQRQIHPLVTANRLEGIPNYVNVLVDFWPEAMRRSSLAEHLNWVIMGTGRPDQFTEGIEGGALFPTHIGPRGASTEQFNNENDYWQSPTNATSVLMPIVKMWQFNQDEQFLRTTLYPMMKSTSIFWEKYVTKENGKYVVYGATHEGNPGRNPILDVDACLYMLRNTIEAANALGVDQDKVAIWQDIIDHMSLVPTFIWHGKETIKEHEGRTPSDPGYTFSTGNPVTIQSVYYFDSIGMTASSQSKEKYFNYLDVKNAEGHPRRLTSATRLGYDIGRIMEQLKAGNIELEAGDWLGLRANNTIGDIGGANTLGVVQDSLLQSNDGFINIFANWYHNQETTIKRMRAKGAFLIDANQNEFGQTTYVQILSEQGKQCAVLNPWQGKEMEVYEDGTLIESTMSTNLLGEVYTFATKPNTKYELKPKGGLSSSIKLDIDEMKLYTQDSQKLTARSARPDSIIKWESDNKQIAVVDRSGKVTAMSAGSANIKAYMEGDPSVYAICHVVVRDIAGENVAVGATASANSMHDSYSPDKAITGKWDENTEGWVSANTSYTTPRWWMVDLGREFKINRWVVKHDGFRGYEQNTTKDFVLQSSPDGLTWSDIDPVVGNTDNVTDRHLEEPVTARYFRIYITVADQYNGQWPNNMARINQVGLYAISQFVAQTQLTGPDEVISGDAFAVGVDLAGVKESVYGQDLTIKYDDTKLELVSVVSAVEVSGVRIVQTTRTAPGEERVSSVNLSEDEALKKNHPLTLNFKVKDGLDAGSTEIIVSDVMVSNGLGVNSAVKGTAHSLSIKPDIVSVSTDATLTSTIGTVSTGSTANESITNIPYETTLAALKAAITPAANATFEVYDADGTTVATVLATGKKVIVTAQDGTTKVTYTVTVMTVTEIPSYTMTYNGNGAISGNAPTDSGSYAQGVTVSVYGNTGNLVKTGYTFAGWNTEADGSGTSYAEGSPFIMGTSNTTLYAKWTANNTGGSSSNGGTPSVTPSNNTMISTDGTLTLSIGKSGEVSLGDEVKIMIPADASGKELKITIEKVADSQKLLTSKDVLVSPVFEILKNFPENFNKEITMTFTFDPKRLKGNQKPSVFFYDEIKKVWVEVGGEVKGNTITIKVNHFTKYAVLATGQGEDSAAVTKQPVNFSDISGHWAEASIKQAVSFGIVSGYPDGTFNPNRTVTRAEFAVMLMNTLKPQGDGAELTFTDKGRIGTWAQKSVAQAVQAAIITGYEDSTFRPEAEISRSEMVVMIAKALGQSVEATTATGFADDKDVPDWAKGAVGAMKKLSMIGGKGANAFAPHDKTTRAESVTVLLKMLEQKGK
ncbi:S-layer homology domain-containing protein [Paenibacillus sp. HWE-109]|uniref:S-layer homology domain-containing protein n=1 Tax=Paenibacillus sp. HWE-109 TaxID=1306526 RepID=UPI001EE09C15|nr:S-layer homology domain-containing protein [Paenibacillus sp. HWE-109]UKS31321.1 S-layer homology domain-containing protein [Paenibacillus sp. HWE-109]